MLPLLLLQMDGASQCPSYSSVLQLLLFDHYLPFCFLPLKVGLHALRFTVMFWKAGLQDLEKVCLPSAQLVTYCWFSPHHIEGSC